MRFANTSGVSAEPQPISSGSSGVAGKIGGQAGEEAFGVALHLGRRQDEVGRRDHLRVGFAHDEVNVDAGDFLDLLLDGGVGQEVGIYALVDVALGERLRIEVGVEQVTAHDEAADEAQKGEEEYDAQDDGEKSAPA